MLIEWKVYTGLILGVSTGIGLLFYVARFREVVAASHDSPRHQLEKRFATFLNPFVISAVSIFLISWFFSGHVYVVSGKSKCIGYRVFGGTTIPAPGGTSIDIPWNYRLTDPWLVVNLSDDFVLIQDVAYGTAQPGETVYISPGSVRGINSDINYFFEHDRPPRKVKTRGNRAIYQWLRMSPNGARGFRETSVRK